MTWTRIRLTATWLPLLGLLLGCAVFVQAQAPEAKEPPPPLFRPPVEFEQQLAAGQVLAAAGNAHYGPLIACGHLVAGEHSDARLWRIEPLALTESFQVSSGAVTTFLAAASSQGTGGFPGSLSLLAALRWGDVTDIWTLRDTTRIEAIPPLILPFVKDGRGIPPADSGDLELEAYFTFLIAAHRTPTAVLERDSEKEASYAHLFNEPAKYRGQVIQLQGQLRRIRKFEAPASARIAGIPYLYEGWIFYKAIGANPFCVLFTDLPAGFRVSEEMDVPVKFAGYFYKKYRYTPADQPAGKPNIKRDAPLLIGHSPSLIGTPNYFGDNPPDNWAKSLLPIFVGGILATIVGVFLLVLWTRHSDGRVKKRLATIRAPELTLPEPDADEPPGSSGGSGAESAEQPATSERPPGL